MAFGANAVANPSTHARTQRPPHPLFPAPSFPSPLRERVRVRVAANPSTQLWAIARWTWAALLPSGSLPLHPLQGERQVRASAAETGEGSLPSDSPLHPLLGERQKPSTALGEGSSPLGVPPDLARQKSRHYRSGGTNHVEHHDQQQTDDPESSGWRRQPSSRTAESAHQRNRSSSSRRSDLVNGGSWTGAVVIPCPLSRRSHRARSRTPLPPKESCQQSFPREPRRAPYIHFFPYRIRLRSSPLTSLSSLTSSSLLSAHSFLTPSAPNRPLQSALPHVAPDGSPTVRPLSERLAGITARA